MLVGYVMENILNGVTGDSSYSDAAKLRKTMPICTKWICKRIFEEYRLELQQLEYFSLHLNYFEF